MCREAPHCPCSTCLYPIARVTKTGPSAAKCTRTCLIGLLIEASQKHHLSMIYLMESSQGLKSPREWRSPTRPPSDLSLAPLQATRVPFAGSILIKLPSSINLITQELQGRNYGEIQTTRGPKHKEPLRRSPFSRPGRGHRPKRDSLWCLGANLKLTMPAFSHVSRKPAEEMGLPREHRRSRFHTPRWV
jgi:hypothetical protein